MTDEHPSTQESIAPAEYVTTPAHLDGSWERVGRKAVAQLLDDALDDLTTETELAIDDVRRGEHVSSDHVNVLREVIDTLEYAVEAHVAALADDAEPWSISERPGFDGERRQFARVRCDCDCHDHHGDVEYDAPRSGGVKHAHFSEADQ